MSSRRTLGHAGSVAHGHIDDVDGLFDEPLRLLPGNPSRMTDSHAVCMRLSRKGRRPFTTREYLAARRETTRGHGDTSELVRLINVGALAFVSPRVCVRAGKPVSLRD